MTRQAISMVVPDVSAFARRLRDELEPAAADSLGHQRLLNVIARAGGYRNFQQLKATCGAESTEEAVDGRLLSKVLSRFDDAGRLTAWSTRRKVREYCLWAMWAAIPPRAEFTEAAISELFDELTTFRDAAQIRRSLVEDRRLERDRAGTWYRRVEARPDPTAQAIIRTVRARRRVAGGLAPVDSGS